MQTSLSFWGRMVAARILHKVNAQTAPRRGNLPLQEICVLVEQTAHLAISRMGPCDIHRTPASLPVDERNRHRDHPSRAVERGRREART